MAHRSEVTNRIRPSERGHRMTPPTCYPSCPPPSTIVTHAPVVPHAAAASHLAFTGFAIFGPVALAVGLIVLGALFIYAHRLRRS